MRIFLIVLLVFNLVQAKSTKLTSSYQIKDFVSKVPKDGLINEIRVLVEKSGKGRLIGTAGHQSAREHLMTRIKSLSGNEGKLYIQEFEPNKEVAVKLYKDDFEKEIVGKFDPHEEMFLKWKNFTDHMVESVYHYTKHKGHNIIWEKKGESPETIVVTAHYDTISHDKNTLMINTKDSMPGADYNGSGVTVALGIIDRISKLDLKKTVKVVFLDYQTVGVLGSFHLLDDLKSNRNNIKGVFNLEMLGHDSKFFDKNKKQGNLSLYLRSKSTKEGHKADLSLVNIVHRYKKNCKYSVTFEEKANDFKSSDHIRFWNDGLAAITFSQNWEDDFNEKNYQTKNDFVETLNQKSLYDSFRTISCVLINWGLDL